MDAASSAEPETRASQTPVLQPIVQPDAREIGRYGGDRPGPVLVVTGAIHGNEPAGVIASQRVLARLASERPERFQGTMVALVGNRRALATGDARYLESDLNRMFTPAKLAAARDGLADGTASPEAREALELLAAVEDAFGAHGQGGARTDGPQGLLVDLHTTSAPGPGFIAFEDALPTRRIVQRFPLPLILGFEEELEGLLIDHVSNTLGVPACVIESGQHDDPAAVDGHEAAVWLALDSAGLLPLDAVAHERDPRRVLTEVAGARAGRIFDVRRVVRVRNAECEIHHALTSFDPIVAGKTPVMVEAGEPKPAAETGLLFMPNRQKVKRPGDDAYFVVRAVGPVWLRMSAWTRRREWLHALIPPLLPGVRADPERPGTLIVEPRVALVLRRQVFHLLGYRLLRHGTEHHLPPAKRLTTAVVLVARAVGRAGLAVARFGRLPRPEPRHAGDWVVTRRPLDRAGPRGGAVPGPPGVQNRGSGA